MELQVFQLTQHSINLTYVVKRIAAQIQGEEANSNHSVWMKTVRLIGWQAFWRLVQSGCCFTCDARVVFLFGFVQVCHLLSGWSLQSQLHQALHHP